MSKDHPSPCDASPSANVLPEGPTSIEHPLPRVLSSAEEERLAYARGLRDKLFFVYICLLTLMRIFGDAFFYAYFIMLGHLVLRFVVPSSLDPFGMFDKATLSSTLMTARFGTWIMGVPRLVTVVVSVSFTLEGCASEQNSRPADLWLARWTKRIPRAVVIVLGYGWDTMAGPRGVWINESWSTKEPMPD